MLLWELFSFLLSLYYAFSVAYNLERPLPPLGDLGVTMDYSMALLFPNYVPAESQVKRNWLYSSHLTFWGQVSTITDEQLWQIAHDAYEEMTSAARQYGIINQGAWPIAMSVLAWDNQIILASSQKGDDTFNMQFTESPVFRDLERCRQAWQEGTGRDQRHRNEYRCGETMAAQIYYMLGPNQPHLETVNARIGTVVFNRGRGARPRDPCPGADDQVTDWGCNLFVVSQNLRVLNADLTPAAYDIHDIAGDLRLRGQQQLCGRYRPFDLP